MPQLCPPASRLCRILLLAFGLWGVGCKEIPNVSDDRQTVNARRSGAVMYAADPLELQQNSAFFFQIWNSTFTMALESLPMTGQIPAASQPWTGSYYPETSGGTDASSNGAQSPLQKYDQAFYGGVNTSSAWERSKHSSNVSWAGHCNGFAAAGQRHPTEPVNNVVRGGVTFTPMDIKALMTEVHMSADYQFLGGARCYETTPTGPDSRSDPTVMDACQGINPGTLHAAIGNWVGLMQHVVIMDIYGGDEVWNHPVISYNVLSKNYITAQQAAQAVDGSNSYVFNPNAVNFAQIHAQYITVNANATEVLQTRNTTTNDLTYIIELDANGNIVGGEWTGNSITSHPNFIWVAFDPLPPNGTRYMGNQYVDFKTVLGMWAESVGANPNNPPTDIQRPAAPTAWGQQTNFSAVADGRTSGAAFGGKPIQLHVTRQNALNAGGIEMDVSVNQAAQPAQTAQGTEVLSLPLTPTPGLNILNFTWKQNGGTIQTAGLPLVVDP